MEAVHTIYAASIVLQRSLPEHQPWWDVPRQLHSSLLWSSTPVRLALRPQWDLQSQRDRLRGCDESNRCGMTVCLINTCKIYVYGYAKAHKQTPRSMCIIENVCMYKLELYTSIIMVDETILCTCVQLKKQFESEMVWGESQMDRGTDKAAAPCAKPGCTPFPTCCKTTQETINLDLDITSRVILWDIRSLIWPLHAHFELIKLYWCELLNHFQLPRVVSMSMWLCQVYM